MARRGRGMCGGRVVIFQVLVFMTPRSISQDEQERRRYGVRGAQLCPAVEARHEGSRRDGLAVWATLGGGSEEENEWRANRELSSQRRRLKRFSSLRYLIRSDHTGSNEYGDDARWAGHLSSSNTECTSISYREAHSHLELFAHSGGAVGDHPDGASRAQIAPRCLACRSAARMSRAQTTAFVRRIPLQPWYSVILYFVQHGVP